jgi:hypothetical protein
MNTSKINQKLTRKNILAFTFLVLQLFITANVHAIKLTLNGQPALPNNQVLDLTENIVYTYNDNFRPIVTNSEMPFLCIGPNLAGTPVADVSIGLSSTDPFRIYGLVGVASTSYDYNPVLLEDKTYNINTTADSQCVVKGDVKLDNLNPGNPHLFMSGFEDNEVAPNQDFHDLNITLLEDASGNTSFPNGKIISHGNPFVYRYLIENIGNVPVTFDIADYFSIDTTVLSTQCTTSGTGASCGDSGTGVVNHIGGVYLTNASLATGLDSIIIEVTRTPSITVDNTPGDLLVSALVTNGNDVFKQNNLDTKTVIGKTIIPTQLVITEQLASNANVIAGNTINDPLGVRVAIQDANGNVDVASNSQVSIAIQTGPNGSVLQGVTSVIPVNGIATFDGLSIQESGTYTLILTSAGLTSAASNSFNVTVGNATKLSIISEPVNTVANTSITDMIIHAEDQFGNLDTSNNSQVQVTIKSFTGTAGAALSGTTIVDVINGVATVSGLQINLVGNNYQLEFESDSGLTSTESVPFDITDIPTQIVITSGTINTTVAGTTLADIVVELRYANNNVDLTNNSNVTIMVNTNPSSPNLMGTTTVQAVNGIATFDDLSIQEAGSNYTLTISSGVLTTDTTNSFDIVAGAATNLVITTQPVDTNATNVIPDITLEAQDQYGNVDLSNNSMTAISIKAFTGTSGAVLTGTNQVSVTNGLATFAGLSIDLVGTNYQLTVVSNTTLISDESVMFDIL